MPSPKSLFRQGSAADCVFFLFSFAGWRIRPGNLFSFSFFLFFFLFTFVGWRMRPGPGAWSPPGEGQGVRGASPSTPPTPPYTPFSAWRRAALSSVASPAAARRRGQVGAHLPASRAICAPAAALPRCGDRLRAPARWNTGIFPGLRAARREALSPFRNVAKQQNFCLCLRGSVSP